MNANDQYILALTAEARATLFDKTIESLTFDPDTPLTTICREGDWNDN